MCEKKLNERVKINLLIPQCLFKMFQIILKPNLHNTHPSNQYGYSVIVLLNVMIFTARYSYQLLIVELALKSTLIQFKSRTALTSFSVILVSFFH